MSYKFTEEIKSGSNGDAVKALQNRLIEIHQDKVLTEEGVKSVEADGDFGTITEQAVESLKARSFDIISAQYIKDKYKSITGKDCPEEWLEIDGIVNPLFGLFLEHYNEVLEYLHATIKVIDLTPDKEPEKEPAEETETLSQQLISKVIEIEQGEIGVREDPPCDNTGERVNEYQDIGSGGEIKYGGSPWCNAFQNWALKNACDEIGTTYKATFSVYTPATVEWGKKKDIAIKNPKKSDIKKGMWGFVHSTSRGGGSSISSVHHIYLITGVQGNNVLTLEGNTGNGGSVEGDGVYARIRPINSAHCWVVVDWSSLYD